MRVRVRYVMKWHSLYQSVSHSVTAVVPEYWLPLRPAPLHTATALPLGNSHPSPSWSFRSPFAPPPAFISTLQAVPFQSIISSTPTLALREGGEGGKHAKRCGIFFIIPGTHSKASHGTLPFPSRFPPSHLSPLKLPSSTSP